MFASDYCFPLSPIEKEEGQDQKDLLLKIFEVLGKQDADDLSFISDEATLEYAKQLN